LFSAAASNSFCLIQSFSSLSNFFLANATSIRQTAHGASRLSERIIRIVSQNVDVFGLSWHEQPM
jgi:hypothetical protein